LLVLHVFSYGIGSETTKARPTIKKDTACSSSEVINILIEKTIYIYIYIYIFHKLCTLTIAQ
jgi:hypothetical protein